MKFAQLVKDAVPALRRYARGLMRDGDIADDLVQETLVRALRSEHLFQGADARAWLYTILTNLNRNRLRALSRRPPTSQIQEHDACDFAGPELGSRDIERALATLPDDQRSTLLLVVLEGLTYREIAEVHGVPMGTVTSPSRRALVRRSRPTSRASVRHCGASDEGLGAARSNSPHAKRDHL